ncbi:MAG: OmpA family protein [Pseudomonadota bacterium]
MSGLVKFLVALIALGVLGYFCIGHHAPLIEAAVANNVEITLANGGADAAAAVSGRDVTLTGTVANERVRNDLVADVRSTYGVRVVDDQLVVAAGAPSVPPVAPAAPSEPAPAYSTTLTVEPDSVTLAGDLPDAAAGAALADAISNAFPGREFTSTAQPRNGGVGDWLSRMQGVVAALGQLTFGTAELAGDRLTVRGAAPTATLRRRAEARLGEVAGVDVDARIDIVPLALEEQEAAVESCQARFDEALSGAQILFATGSADIDATSNALLGRLAAIARACPLAQIDIGGHTDNTGDAAYNDYLSGERAKAVRDNLIGRGISADRLSATGYGSRRPVANNATRAGRERNRRIEMQVSVGE